MFFFNFYKNIIFLVINVQSLLSLCRNSDLHHVLCSLDIDKREVDELLNDADLDGDGRIEYEEFVQMMTLNDDRDTMHDGISLVASVIS